MSKNKWLFASLLFCMIASITVPFMSTAIQALVVTSVGFMGVLCLYKGIQAHELARRDT